MLPVLPESKQRKSVTDLCALEIVDCKFIPGDRSHSPSFKKHRFSRAFRFDGTLCAKMNLVGISEDVVKRAFSGIRPSQSRKQRSLSSSAGSSA